MNNSELIAKFKKNSQSLYEKFDKKLNQDFMFELKNSQELQSCFLKSIPKKEVMYGLFYGAKDKEDLENKIQGIIGGTVTQTQCLILRTLYNQIKGFAKFGSELIGEDKELLGFQAVMIGETLENLKFLYKFLEDMPKARKPNIQGFK